MIEAALLSLVLQSSECLFENGAIGPWVTEHPAVSEVIADAPARHGGWRYGRIILQSGHEISVTQSGCGDFLVVLLTSVPTDTLNSDEFAPLQTLLEMTPCLPAPEQIAKLLNSRYPGRNIDIELDLLSSATNRSAREFSLRQSVSASDHNFSVHCTLDS